MKLCENNTWEGLDWLSSIPNLAEPVVNVTYAYAQTQKPNLQEVFIIRNTSNLLDNSLSLYRFFTVISTAIFSLCFWTSCWEIQFLLRQAPCCWVYPLSHLTSTIFTFWLCVVDLEFTQWLSGCFMLSLVWAWSCWRVVPTGLPCFVFILQGWLLKVVIFNSTFLGRKEILIKKSGRCLNSFKFGYCDAIVNPLLFILFRVLSTCLWVASSPFWLFLFTVFYS